MVSRAPETSLADLLAQATWLRRLAATLVAGEAAEDLVQETWLAALKHPPRRSGPLRPWLARVARNLAANLRRGEARRAQHEGRAASAAPAESARADDPRSLAEEVEAQRLLAEAVLRLEEPLRSTVVLRYFRGLDSSAIGRLQGASSGTVRWRLKRGLELLRADLEARSGGERSWRAVFAALAPRAGTPLTPPLRGTSSPGAAPTLAAGATLMSASTKVGIAAAVALAALFTAWVMVDDTGKPPATLAAREESLLDSPPPASTREPDVVGDPEASGEPRTALLPTPASLAEPALEDCCIVGRVVDRDRRGISGARVVARAAELDPYTLRAQHASKEPPRETRSGADGSFSLEVPELRPFVLTAEHPDFAAGAGALAFAGEQRDIVLTAGSTLLVQVSTSQASGQAAKSTLPCAGAVVRAHIALGDSGDSLWAGEGTTDASGEVAFRGLPAGSVAIEASFARQRARGRATTDGEAPVTCSLELRSTGRLAGTVLDRATQLPIAGARVGIAFHAETTTDRAGRYALEELSLGPGTFSLGARARGYASRYEYLVLDEGRARRTVEFELEPAVQATGTVLDPAGRPVAGASVLWTAFFDTAAFTGETERGEVSTDSLGRFALEDLQAGTTYRLLVFAPGYALGIFACGPLAAPAAGSPPVELGSFTLDLGGSIAGDVLDARNSGGPFFVQLHWAGEDAGGVLSERFSHLETSRTDPRGRFAFEGLAAGRYRLALWRSADPEWSETPLAEEIVSLSAGEERQGIVLGKSQGTIRGTVTKGSGAPFRQCRLRLFALSEPEKELGSAYSDEEGRFVLHVHDPGPFRIVADDQSLMFDSSSIEPVLAGDDLSFALSEFRSEHVIRGRLLTDAGEIAENVFVSFTDTRTKERLARVAIPGPDGRFEMKNLRDVAYDLESVDFSNEFEIARIPGVRPGDDEVELRLRWRE